MKIPKLLKQEKDKIADFRNYRKESDWYDYHYFQEIYEKNRKKTRKRSYGNKRK